MSEHLEVILKRLTQPTTGVDCRDVCSTCRLKGREHECDGKFPQCSICSVFRVRCGGYVHIEWHDPLQQRRAPVASKVTKPRTASRPSESITQLSLTATDHTSLGLPPSESLLIQHYLKNVARVAVAIDYSENGYRQLMLSNINDTCTLNSVLAVSASHHCKLQGFDDSESRRYLMKAFSALQKRLSNPKDVYQETTIIFNGTKKWDAHYRGIMGWLSARGDCANLNPFVKTWISMVDTQRALNVGGGVAPQVQVWIDSSAAWLDAAEVPSIDPFFGCSVQLPRLMVSMARLYELSQWTEKSGCPTREELVTMATELQQCVRDTAIDLHSEPLIAVSYHFEHLVLDAIEDINRRDYFRRVVAVAEIFRHTAHIYIFRAVNDPTVPASTEVQESIDQIIELLPLVPDALGPGSNLGWCLTVVGSELDDPDHREYIRIRLKGIQVLGFENLASGLKVLETIWEQRDHFTQGRSSTRVQRYQEAMHSMREGEMLV